MKYSLFKLIKRKCIYIKIVMPMFICIVSLVLLNCQNVDRIDKSIFIQIGDKKLTASDFLTDVNLISKTNLDSRAHNAKLLDSYITARLYLMHAKNEISTNGSSSLDLINNDLSRKLLKKKAQEFSISQKLLRTNYKRNEDILILDYVWFPDSLKKEAKEMKVALEAGEDLELFIERGNYAELISKNVLVFPKRLIKGGSLKPKIERVAYSLGEREVKIVNIKSGIYVLKLIKKFQNKTLGDFDLERYFIKKRALNAYLEENKSYIHSPILFDKKVIIDLDKLELMNFYFKPINDTTELSTNNDQVIARSILGKEILMNDFIEYIQSNPVNAKIFLTDPDSRIKGCEYIILKMLEPEILGAVKAKINLFKEDLLVEEVIKNRFLKYKKYCFSKDSIIIEFSDWIYDIIKSNPKQPSIRSLLLLEAYKSKLDKNLGILKKVESFASNLNKKELFQKYSFINSSEYISLNYNILDTLNTNLYLQDQDRNITNLGDSEVTEKSFLKNVAELTVDTKLELLSVDNCCKLIEYISKNVLTDVNINRKLFSNLDYYFSTSAKDYITLDRNDIIARYDTLELSANDLRSQFFQLTTGEKQQLLNGISRENIIKKLIRKTALRKEAESFNLNIEKELNKQIESNRVDYDQLFFQFFKIHFDAKLKKTEGLYLQLAVKKILEDRLDTLINNQIDNKNIYLDFEKAAKFNIDTKLSIYKDYFISLD